MTRLRAWLVIIVLATAIVWHKPIIGIVVAILLVISMVNAWFVRRKQRRNA